MDRLTLRTSATTNSLSAIRFFSQPFLHSKHSRILTFPYKKPRNHLVFALKSEPKLDDWDQMELKFGRMIGEDPKITLAKIMGRKSNPDLSYLEIEKLLDKKKGRALDDEIEEIPFDVSDEKKSTKSIQGLNLVRPVPKKGTKFEATNKAVESDCKKSSRSVKKAIEKTKSSVPNVILRKPSLFNEDDDGANGKSSKFGMKPNLSLKMGKKPQKDRFSDITLLKKPEPVAISDKQNGQSDSSDGKDGVMDENGDKGPKYTLPQKPELINVDFNKEGEQESSKVITESNFNNVAPEDKFGSQIVTVSISYDNQFQETRRKDSGLDEGSAIGEMSSGEETFASDGSSRNIHALSMDSVFKGKPKRLDRSSKETDQKIREEVIPKNRESFGNPSELENFLTTSPIKEGEDVDWARAEKLVKTGERKEVELITSSTRGFVIIDAKVHQLDFSLECIFLSLKEITPDPLMEALEAVVGDLDSLDGGLEAVQADIEWADVEFLVKELEQF